MSRHVVFGTGQIGRLVASRLVGLGADVTPVNRSGRGAIDGTRVVAGDAADPMFTTRVCAGADVVYFCLNPPRYDTWAQEFPPMQRGVLAGAEAAGAHRAGRVEVAIGRASDFFGPGVTRSALGGSVFGILATPLDDALATTTTWYRDAGPATRGPHE